MWIRYGGTGKLGTGVPTALCTPVCHIQSAHNRRGVTPYAHITVVVGLWMWFGGQDRKKNVWWTL